MHAFHSPLCPFLLLVVSYPIAFPTPRHPADDRNRVFRSGGSIRAHTSVRQARRHRFRSCPDPPAYRGKTGSVDGHRFPLHIQIPPRSRPSFQSAQFCRSARPTLAHGRRRCSNLLCSLATAIGLSPIAPTVLAPQILRYLLIASISSSIM
jgi:hypothetical protein